MYKDELSIFIPNSFLSESKDLKIRTYKVGILGRALAIFQADNVVIYNDDHVKNEDGEMDGEFIAEILNYMNTPQYLRKQAFPIRPELKHVGILSGVEIISIADIPGGTGLGSSSCYTVGLLNALSAFNSIKKNPQTLLYINPSISAKDACMIEIDKLSAPIGK